MVLGAELFASGSTKTSYALWTRHTLATFRHCGNTVFVVEEKSVAIYSCLENLGLAVSSKQVSSTSEEGSSYLESGNVAKPPD